MADQVAAVEIPLTPGEGGASGPAHKAESTGLRPLRFSALKVAVMDPHAMWDARDDQAGVRRVADDAGLRDAVVPAAPSAVRAVAPVLARREVEAPATAQKSSPSRDAALRPARSNRTIQLGAYSSAAAARQAWGRLKASDDLARLTPVYETVQVQGRTLTRLKVGPASAETAAALCRAAAVADAWCARNS